MKNLIIASLLVMSSNAFASKLVTLKSLSNPGLEATSKTISSLSFSSHSSAKKVLELKGKGTTAQEIRQSAMSQAFHMLCPFFDDGVRIGLNTKNEKGTNNAVADYLELNDTAEIEAEILTLTNAVGEANKLKGVEIYSGATSGNNTVGTVLGFYDVEKNELAVFANTNCGSDN